MIFHSTYKRPILIVGNGVRSSNAVELLHKLYAKTKIPILTSMNAVDLVQDDLHIGFIGVYGNRIANIIVSNSDLVIAIGVRLGLRQIGNKSANFAPNAKLIRVDIDEYELSRYIKEDEIKCHLDAKDFLEQLLNENIPVYDDWNRRCFEAKDILSQYDKQIGNKCIEKISSMLPANPIVAVDVGQNQCWSAQSLHLKGNDGRILIGGGYGSMGCALPYAIGASHASKNKIVYCITGDGGMQMNIQELQTIVSENLPIKILIVNNKALGKIREIQTFSYDGRFLITSESSGYTVPDFAKVAMAYGIKAKNIDGYEKLDYCQDWLQDEDPCVINIILPEDTILLPKMNWNQKEMIPLLDESILNKIKQIMLK